MKLRSLVLVLAIALVVGPAASALANTNPFSDVPADHWAYDAVIQLAAVGLVEGYPDGTYGGTRMMTRYEAALVFARTLARLEALVEEEVYATNADLRAQVVAEVLADIEAAKAELAALIKEELANIEVPVVEHTIERVVVEQPIEKVVEVQPVERPFELTPEAEQVIAALVADLFRDELAAAELGAKEVVTETKIIERIVEAEDALTEEDVNRIVEAILAAELERVYASQEGASADLNARVDAAIAKLAADVADLEYRHLTLINALRADVNALTVALDKEIAKVTESIYALSDEFETELALLGVRVNTLEKLFLSMEDRITAVEGRVAMVEKEQGNLRKDMERVQLSGKLTFDASSHSHNLEDKAAKVTDFFGNEYKHDALDLTQKGELTLTVKASDSVTVKAFTAYTVNIFGDDKDLTFKSYRAEVTSDSLITRFVAGTLKDQVKGFNSYVLGKGSPEQGATADFKFLEGFTGNAVVGGVDGDLVGGLALSYKFIPELGLKGAVTGTRNDSKIHAVSAGVFGELFGVEYEGNFAMDLTDEDAEDAMLFGGKLSGEFGPVSLSGSYVMAGKDFGKGTLSKSKSPLLKAEKGSAIEVGAGVDFLGIDVDGNYYREMDAENENAAVVQAYKFGATAKFDVFVPLTLSGSYAWNQTGEDERKATEVKAAIGDIDLFDTGVTFGTSVAYKDGRLKDGAYKTIKNFEMQDKQALVVGAKLGYAADVRGAGLDLGYGVEFVMPLVEEGQESTNELTHKITADYSFTKDLTLKLGATVFHTLEENAEVAQKYTAGLSFTF